MQIKGTGGAGLLKGSYNGSVLKNIEKTMNEMINFHTLGVIFKYGDITEVTSVNCIVQQCNCLTVHSHGLSKTISEKYPWSNLYERRRAVQNHNLAIPEDRGTRGTVEIMKFPELNIPDVVCLLAQWDFGVGSGRQIEPHKDTPENRQKWFKECMMKFGLLQYRTVAFPFKIGCGLAQGYWKVYFKMIKDMTRTYKKQVIIVVPK
jgi:O-acetyl-ADP-ribose deacetylase (regulator of RNase III)